MQIVTIYGREEDVQKAVVLRLQKLQSQRIFLAKPKD